MGPVRPWSRALGFDKDEHCGYNGYMQRQGKTPIAVGVRQLKNSLTRYLRLVATGHSFVITNRNQPVAVLQGPLQSPAKTSTEKLATLVAEGKLIPPTKQGPFTRFKPLKMRGQLLSRMIIEERR